LGQTVAEVYEAKEFRILNNEILEVIYYADEDNKVVVRQQAGEDLDISGDYTNYPTVTEIKHGDGVITQKTDGTTTLIIGDNAGYSYSIYAPNGFLEGGMENFMYVFYAQ